MKRFRSGSVVGNSPESRGCEQNDERGRTELRIHRLCLICATGELDPSFHVGERLVDAVPRQSDPCPYLVGDLSLIVLGPVLQDGLCK